MQPTRILQIVLALAMGAQAEASPLACLKPDEIQKDNYKLQSPQGYYDGTIADGAIVLRIYLDVTREREVFALTGKFAVEQDGQQVSPVFICERGKPVWYDMGHYIVGCPIRDYGPVRVISPTMDLFEPKRMGLTYWADQCIAWRRLDFTCGQPHIFPPIEYCNPYWGDCRMVRNPDNLDLVPRCIWRVGIDATKVRE